MVDEKKIRSAIRGGARDIAGMVIRQETNISFK